MFGIPQPAFRWISNDSDRSENDVYLIRNELTRLFLWSSTWGGPKSAEFEEEKYEKGRDQARRSEDISKYRHVRSVALSIFERVILSSPTHDNTHTVSMVIKLCGRKEIEWTNRI